jgi:hypothetical protein
MKCSICKREIEVGPGGWSEGHNADPITKGRCCDTCNATIVVPTRIAAVYGVRFNPLKEGEGAK